MAVLCSLAGRVCGGRPATGDSPSTPGSLARLLIGLFLALVCLPGFAQMRTVDRAEVLLLPRGGDPVSRQVALPDRWDRHFPGQDGRAIYRFELVPPAEAQDLGIFLARVGNQVVVRVDGRQVFSAGTLDRPHSDAAKLPVLVEVPPREGSVPVSVEVEVSAQHGRWGGLSLVRWGPLEEARAEWRLRHAWRAYGSVAIAFGMAVLAALTLAIWWITREAVLVYLATGGALGVLIYLNRVWTEPPLAWPYWGVLVTAVVIPHAVLLERALLALVSVHRAWLDRATWAVAGVGVVAPVLAFGLRQPAIWTVTLVVSLAVTVWVAWQVGRQALVRRSRETVLAALMIGIVLFALAGDVLMVRLAGHGPGAVSLAPLATLAGIALTGWMLVNRYAASVREYEQLFMSLDARVTEREKELRENMRQLQQEQEQKGVLMERQRIMRDIHDGLGVHLVSLMGLLERSGAPREVLQAQARNAMDELRMAVDALQPVHSDLATVLATLRYRLQPRLDSAGIELSWDVDAMPTSRELTPRTVLQMQRVLMEAFTNILRHAGASRIWVTAIPEGEGRWRLRVDDDGRGMPPADASVGHGLRNMHARAVSIGAELIVGERPGGGTRVELRL